ncbi:putative glycoside hydrolase [Geodermatophilus dictyosporus]|nr:putative glycoside hydrolase [Geodermatophilus dictyosporus]
MVLTALPSASVPGREQHDASVLSACRPAATASADPVVRRGFWYAIGDRPTVEEVDAAASRYGVVVLNPWETWALDRIKQRDPSVVVLVYKDLSSTRSYHTGPLPPTGVAHAEADPSWFAVDEAGERIEWDPYPGHWQMAVWDPAYQQRWVDDVVAEVRTAGWDGVLADNDLATLGWYDSALLAGTGSPAETDARLRDGLDALVVRAGQALQAEGRLLVPNVSDARLTDGRWASHAAYGGAMEENFAHWGTDPYDGFLWDWGPTGWVTQTEQLASPGLTVSVTRAAAGDDRTLRYAYASVLVRGDGQDYWSPSTTPAGDYTRPESLPEMDLPLGEPTAGAVRLSSGAWTRTYASGWAAVNPTQATVTLTPPKGAVDRSGQRVTSVTLPPTSGTVLRVDCRR